MRNVVKDFVITIYNIMHYTLSLDKKTIVFESSVGRNYSGNPKAIYEEMIVQGLDKVYKCIWILEDINEHVPGKCKKVKRLRIRYFYYMIRAKFWVMDSRQPTYLKKKKGNVYIQTWHGTPLKKLGLDMSFVNMSGDNDIENYKNAFEKDSRMWDYLISQNAYSTEIFKSAFAFDKEILEIGYPRNDMLINTDEKQLKELKFKLNIPENYKVILYAPTWRDNQYNEKGKYKFIMPINLKQFVDNFGDEYILILKPHYLIVDKFDISNYIDNVRLCEIEQDIQQLYIISDILITDYSSVMFDYSILKRPIIFYMYDLEEYQNEIRGFYFDILEEAPGKIVLNNKELINAIKNINCNTEKYIIKYDTFNKKYNAKDDGNSSKTIIELIESYK